MNRQLWVGESQPKLLCAERVVIWCLDPGALPLALSPLPRESLPLQPLPTAPPSALAPTFSNDSCGALTAG